jgi:membrane protein CcdC involved in cytochrome C biogenesis
LRQYWPLIVILLTIAATDATLDDDIRVLPPFMLLALVLVLLVPIFFYVRRRSMHALARFLGWGLVTLSTSCRGEQRVPPDRRIARRADA